MGDLADALEVDGYNVRVDVHSDGSTAIEWAAGGKTAAAALYVLHEGFVEWVSFHVEPDHRGAGFFSACLRLQDGYFAEHGMGPSRIDADAPEADFYLEAGFGETGDGYIVQDSDRSAAWLFR